MKKAFVFLILFLATFSSFAQSSDSTVTRYQAVFDDPKVKNYFSVSVSNKIHSGISSSKVVSSTAYSAFEIGAKAITLFSNLLYCNENQIELPKSLKDRYLSYCFKADSLANKAAGEKLLFTRLVEHLKLKTIVSETLQDILVVAVIDSAKLKKAKSVKKNETGITEINTRDTNAISIENGTYNTLAEELKRALTLQVEIRNRELFNDHYDFNLNKDSFEVLQESLLSYGLSLKKEQKILQKYRFED